MRALRPLTQFIFLFWIFVCLLALGMVGAFMLGVGVNPLIVVLVLVVIAVLLAWKMVRG